MEPVAGPHQAVKEPVAGPLQDVDVLIFPDLDTGSYQGMVNRLIFFSAKLFKTLGYCSEYRYKRQCHEIFDPLFFSLNCTPGSPDSWAKTVLHIDSNLRSYPTSKIDSPLCRIAQIYDSALCSIARSRKSALCGIGPS
jgi:hypothetical protein